MKIEVSVAIEVTEELVASNTILVAKDRSEQARGRG